MRRSPPATPARALAWEFQRRHRWGFIACGAYLIALAAVKLVIVARGHPVVYDSDETFALAVMGPITATFTYCLAVFTYGLSGDIAGRPSMYPRRLFTLPVSTAALAGWPMLSGTIAAALLWAATRAFVLWPSGVAVPVLWPAIAAAALLAWTQALTWMPYGLPGLRVILAVLWLGTIQSIVLLALRYNAGERLMLAITAPLIPLAYLTARVAVARARRGMVPDWRGAFTWIARLAPVRTARGRFASPARAQAWLEWRRHGWTLPALVGILLPCELALLFATGDTPSLVWIILFGVLLTPPFMAAFVAATVRKPDLDGREAREDYGLAPFLATRPLSNRALVAAKLEMSLWSTAVTWTFVLIAIPVALLVTDTWPAVLERWHRTIALMGEARASMLALLIVAGFVVSTWRQLVQTLYIGMTGRVWIVRASLVGTVAFVCVIGPVLDWIAGNGAVQTALWNAAPTLLAVLAFVKMCGAMWVAVRLYRSRLLHDRTLVIGAAAWCATVLALAGVLAWWIESQFFPRYLFLLCAVLVVPLVRLAAAPLALDWNRHR
ncbi:MAG TPA: hypothetical protein VFP39_15375 [Gemmatimonadales bacterium]|nr:hypothetical protein [Gemmatimonadales bacterium]